MRFGPFLWKFVLVFFDDILIYSPSLQMHLQHLSQVLEQLSEHQLKVNKKKCSFGQHYIEHLGHGFLVQGYLLTPRR